MTQKYSLHRNEAGGFTATFDDGHQYSGSLKDIRAMFEGPEETVRVRRIPFPWTTINSTAAVTPRHIPHTIGREDHE